MKIEGTKRSKILLTIQIILLIAGIALDIIANHYVSNNVALLKISEYCLFLVIVVMPFIIQKDDSENEDKK